MTRLKASQLLEVIIKASEGGQSAYYKIKVNDGPAQLH